MNKIKNITEELKSAFALIVIPLTLVASYTFYFLVLGHGSNFEGGSNEGHPINYLGIVYKGGLIVPILIAFFIMVVTFSIERFITINSAVGKGKLKQFVKSVKQHINKGHIDLAIAQSLEQQGSVGNVVYSALQHYPSIASDPELTKEQKKQSLQQEFEEAIALELPVLEKNLTILATLASTATLVGLLGTVVGMIKAFAALATTGAPDASALANGISEALINTALGIGSSALAIFAYNYFNSKIDGLIHHIDEIGFSITQHFTLTKRSNELKNGVRSLRETVN